MIAPAIKITAPTTANTSVRVDSDFGISRFDAAMTSEGDGVRGGCMLTGVAPAFSSCRTSPQLMASASPARLLKRLHSHHSHGRTARDASDPSSMRQGHNRPSHLDD